MPITARGISAARNRDLAEFDGDFDPAAAEAARLRLPPKAQAIYAFIRQDTDKSEGQELARQKRLERLRENLREANNTLHHWEKQKARAQFWSEEDERTHLEPAKAAAVAAKRALVAEQNKKTGPNPSISESQLDAWLAKRVNCDLENIEVEAPLMKGQTDAVALDDNRAEAGSIAAEHDGIDLLNRPTEEARPIAIKQIEARARKGAPNVAPLLSAKRNSPGLLFATTYDASAPDYRREDSVGLLCWLFKEELIARVDELIEQRAFEGEFIAFEDRAPRKAELAAKLDALEWKEHEHVRRIRAQGGEAFWRRDGDIAKILQVRVIPRPQAKADAEPIELNQRPGARFSTVVN